MNNNQNNERALLAGCNGVFAATSYITIGEPGKPLVYPSEKAFKDRSCYKGKQIITNPPKEGKGIEVYFEKKHPWLFDGEKYIDKQLYIHKQKEKKKGFMTGDFMKRDEFSNTIRTGQYRELLKLEVKHRQRALAMQAELDQEDDDIKAKLDQEEAEKAARSKGVMLFDLIFETDKTDDETLFEKNKMTTRDTKNPTKHSYDRNFGTYATAAMNYGIGIAEEEHAKPTYARLPIIKSTFYRPGKVPLKQEAIL
jgi:hypothetical protein